MGMESQQSAIKSMPVWLWTLLLLISLVLSLIRECRQILRNFITN